MVNSNTSKTNQRLEAALAGIPSKFRKRIIKYYFEIKKRYSKALFGSEYDSAGLSVGKFAENIMRFIQYELIGTYKPFGQHIQNFPD